MVLPFFLLAHALKGNQESVLNQIMVKTVLPMGVPLYSRHVESINVVCHFPAGIHTPIQSHSRAWNETFTLAFDAIPLA